MITFYLIFVFLNSYWFQDGDKFCYLLIYHVSSDRNIALIFLFFFWFIDKLFIFTNEFFNIFVTHFFFVKNKFRSKKFFMLFGLTSNKHLTSSPSKTNDSDSLTNVFFYPSSTSPGPLPLNFSKIVQNCPNSSKTACLTQFFIIFIQVSELIRWFPFICRGVVEKLPGTFLKL